ncbi:glycosyltransferase [Lentzea sp. NPDC059081]|uniref:glycosyltransferase n=1 Tax=Lentzea sp. NPDC059081 TaxID=3346719 RepID=UPI0036AE85E1
MKLGAAIPVLNEWRFLPAVAGQLLQVADRVLVLRGTRSLSGAPAELTPVPPLDPRIEVVEAAWASEQETRNAGLDALADCDWVFCLDTDEILLDPDLHALVRLCEQDEHQAISARLRTYWKTIEHRVDPPEDLTAPVVVRRGARFLDRRFVDAEPHFTDIWLRHLSYVRTDAEVRDKLRLFGHAHEIVPNWYEDVWLGWDADHDLRDLHPTRPPVYRRVVHEPDAELRRVLERHGVDLTGLA